MVFAVFVTGVRTTFFLLPESYSYSGIRVVFFMPGISQLIVYTLDCCPNCDKLKAHLQKNGVSYSERDMSTAESLTELRVNGVFVNEAPVLQNGDDFLTTIDIFVSGAVNEGTVKKFLSGA